MFRPTAQNITDKLHEMNSAFTCYENAQRMHEKESADHQFNECYEWLIEAKIPIRFNEGKRLWEFL